MVKHTQTIRRQQLTNCLSVFDHFEGLALKSLRIFDLYEIISYYYGPAFSLSFRKINNLKLRCSTVL